MIEALSELANGIDRIDKNINDLSIIIGNMEKQMQHLLSQIANKPKERAEINPCVFLVPQKVIESYRKGETYNNQKMDRFDEINLNNSNDLIKN